MTLSYDNDFNTVCILHEKINGIEFHSGKYFCFGLSSILQAILRSLLKWKIDRDIVTTRSQWLLCFKKINSNASIISF